MSQGDSSSMQTIYQITVLASGMLVFGVPLLEKLNLRVEKRIFHRLKEKGAYEELARRYEKVAKRKKKQYLRDNMFGMAALYRHDAENAAVHFQNALKAAQGNDVNVISNNLALAYMQGGWFRNARAILEKQREHVPILPYTLMLLSYGEEQEARRFYERNSVRGEEDSDMKIILGVSPLKPETMQPVKELLEQQHLWLYQPVVRELIARWELRIFYNSTDKYEVMVKQAEDLLATLERQPELFNDMNLRYMRQLIASVIHHIGSYDSCSRLWGIIDNLDEFSRNLPLNEKLKEECKLLWRRIYYVFSQTCSVESYDPDLEQKFIKEQLPADAKPVMNVHSRCNLHVSKSLHQNVRSFQVEQNGFCYYCVHLIDDAQADEITRDIMPVIEVMDEEPSTTEVLEPLLYKLVSDRKAVTDSIVIDVMNQVPSAFHVKLKKLLVQD